MIESTMCGRFVLHTPATTIGRMVGIAGQVGTYNPRYNIAPGEPILNVEHRLGSRSIETIRWGLVPHWAPADWDGPTPINARADKVATSGMYKASLRGTPGGPHDSQLAGRSLIFADGFFEPDKRGPKGPYPQHYFWSREGGPLAFAGLFAQWRASPTDPLHLTCTIITTEPNATVGQIHPRMPAILPPERWEAWLDPSNHDAAGLADLLGPAPDDLLDCHRIDHRLLNQRQPDGRWYNKADLLEPVDA